MRSFPTACYDSAVQVLATFRMGDRVRLNTRAVPHEFTEILVISDQLVCGSVLGPYVFAAERHTGIIRQVTAEKLAAGTYSLTPAWADDCDAEVVAA